MTLIIYDEEVPTLVAGKLIELGATCFVGNGKISVLQAPIHTEALMHILNHSVETKPLPWQNAAPYLKRKKGRS